MKRNLSLIILAVFLAGVFKLNAQCNLNPTIAPDQLIFCPYATDTLSTQKYDSYQWLKNNKPIPGATERQLIVHQQDDQGYTFRVVVTKNGCKDTSARVLADGWAFIPPILIETGDLGVLNPRLDALIECPDDTLTLILGEPYTQHVQWYNFQKPIKGATSQQYNVVHSGSYTVCGAPEICPNYFQCESLPLNAIFENPVATIAQQGDSLVASDARKYQWFLYNKKIEGANSRYYLPEKNGPYTVITIDKYKCSARSDPYFYTAHHNLISVAPNPVKDILHVHTDANDAKQLVLIDLYGNEKLKTPVTGKDQNMNLQNLRGGTYILRLINSSGQQLSSLTVVKE